MTADVNAMFAALTNSSLATTNMLYHLGGMVQDHYARSASQQGFRSLKPKHEVAAITCGSAALLAEEIMNFEIDLQELGVTDL